MQDTESLAGFDGRAEPGHPTGLIAEWVASASRMHLGGTALTWAKHALLDWSAVTSAGARDPMVTMLMDEYVDTYGGACSLLGTGATARPLEAALINGCAGHALDFDDVSSRMVGHPTAPVAPAALAMAQAHGATGLELLRAIIVGHEVEARIGELLGSSHYQKGFHTTGTIGSFGAAAACAALKGLEVRAVRNALGLAATQAAGLKCMFGTMAKPLHAGKAAMNGVMAVQLAARGFTAHESAIECEQGFARTQAMELGAACLAIDTHRSFAIESTLFKYHAACYLTHAVIEATQSARRRHALDLNAMASMTLTVSEGHRGVCDITSPQTGLNLKFAIQHLAALALDGADTASLALYTDQAACDPRYVEARQRVALHTSASCRRHQAMVTIHTRDGRKIHEEADVGVPASDLPMQWARLVAKAETIAAPVIGQQRFKQLVAAIDTLDQSPSLQPFMEAIA
ncbi:MAG: MmgE/PrpD family protein [Cupriavidus necator]